MKRLAADEGELVVAVRNTNKWDTAGRSQCYALAVVLERDERYPELYRELRAKLAVEVQQEIRLEG